MFCFAMFPKESLASLKSSLFYFAMPTSSCVPECHQKGWELSNVSFKGKQRIHVIRCDERAFKLAFVINRNGNNSKNKSRTWNQRKAGSLCPFIA